MNNLNTKEKNFLSALRSHPKLGIFSVDADLVCLEWNAGMLHLTGLPDSDVVHQNILNKFPDLLDSFHLTYIREAFKGEKIYKESVSLFPFSCSSKEKFTISYLPIFSEENKVEGCFLLIQEEEAVAIKKDLEKIQTIHETILQVSGAGIWQITPTGYTNYLNPAMCSILGIQAIDDLKGKTFHSFFSEATLNKMKEEHLKRTQHISSTYEAELIRPTGEIRNIMIHGAPLLSEDGQVEAFIGTFIDITDKKSAEIELKKSEERFRLFFEKTLTPTGISRNGTLLLVNDACLKLFKFDSAEELIGKSVLSLIDEQHHAEVIKNIQDRREGKEAPSSYELIGIKKDGTRFLFELEISSIDLPDGTATIVAIKDISEQKEAELALKASESKFRGLFSSNMIGIAFSNTDWKILEANNKFWEIIQYGQEEITGFIDWTSITPPEYYEKDEHAYHEYMLKGHISPYEKEYIRKDGTRVPVLIAAASLEDPYSGVTFVIDITDLKQSKEETNKIANELSTFLYMASHDLKGPLASVIGLTNIARIDLEDLKALEYINLIQECTLKLDRSLMNFLKIIRIKNNVLNHDPIDFNELIEDIISSLKHQVSFSKAEFLITNNTTSTFYSDTDILKSIIQNLVENSVKYQTRLREPLIKIQIEEDGENIMLLVDDNGRGIDEKIKDKIFDMFYRGDISSKGSGLGLYIVKNAAEKLGGIVEAKNKAEGGSVFKVTIPKTKY